MITSIQGTLVAASPLRAVIESSGLGYEVNIPVTTAEKLPAAGGVVKLHTLVIYREDAQTLYGFAAPADRDFFRLLIEKVTGVGPKGALSIMSRLSRPRRQSASNAGDSATLAKCPGIGKKTAEQLVVELKGALGRDSTITTSSQPAADGGAGADSRQRDAVLALTALGYKAADADQAVRQAMLALGPSASTEALIKKALS